jgi:transcriptional repressor NrdR
MGKVNRELAASAIGDLVKEKLGALDKVAYIRFVSVYHHFENVEEFVREIQKLEVVTEKKGTGITTY